MGGALAGHTLFFLQNLIPRLPHVRVLLCDGVEQGKVGVVAGHTFSFSRTSSRDCPMSECSSVMVWSKENGCIVGVVTLWH